GVGQEPRGHLKVAFAEAPVVINRRRLIGGEEWIKFLVGSLEGVNVAPRLALGLDAVPPPEFFSQADDAPAQHDGLRLIFPARGRITALPPGRRDEWHRAGEQQAFDKLSSCAFHADL